MRPRINAKPEHCLPKTQRRQSKYATLRSHLAPLEFYLLGKYILV
jgi:hypothetical protein